MVVEPNLKKDKFISTKEVSVLVEGMSSVSFEDGKMYSDSCLHYNADLYRNSNGEEYYIFRQLKYCTLFIMNCNEEIYKALSKQIKLDDDMAIFETITEEDGKETYIFIPVSYRHKKGFGGNIAIFTN